MKIQHLEDFVMTANPVDVVDLLSALVHNVYGGIDIGNLSVKFDGLMLVYGMEDGRFFISNKSYFNKTPVKFFSTEQIMAHPKWDSEKLQKLAWYFIKLRDTHWHKDLKPANWVKTAEVLLCPWSKTFERSSKPNILEYHFDHIFEFYYSDHFPSLETIRKGIPKDKNNLNWFVLRGICYQLHPVIPMMPLEDFKHFSKIVNLALKEGKDIEESLGYFYNIMNCQQKLVDLYMTAMRWKNEIINSCREVVKTPGIKVTFNGEPAEHEGFVFRYKNHIIKLVDRHDFSAKNFSNDTSRGWKID